MTHQLIHCAWLIGQNSVIQHLLSAEIITESGRRFHRPRMSVLAAIQPSRGVLLASTFARRQDQNSQLYCTFASPYHCRACSACWRARICALRHRARKTAPSTTLSEYHSKLSFYCSAAPYVLQQPMQTAHKTALW